MLQIRMLLQEIIRLLQRIRKAYTNVVSGVARIQMIVIGRTHLVSLDYWYNSHTVVLLIATVTYL